MDPAINVAVRPDGNYQIGSETLNAQQFDNKLDELAKSGFGGNFKLGDALTMDLAGVRNLVSSGPLKSTELTLPAPTATGAVAIDPEVVDKKLESFARLMNDVFKLIAETASTERKSAREGRHAAQAAEQAGLASQVEKMKDAASKAFEGALIQGIIGIASGAVSAAVSVVSAGVSIGGAGATLGIGAKVAGTAIEKTVNSVVKSVTTAVESANQALATASKSFMSTAASSGDIAKGGVDMQADQLRAEGVEAESQSKVDAAMAADENEFMQNYQEMQREIRQKMAGIIEAQNATLSNLARA